MTLTPVSNQAASKSSSRRKKTTATKKPSTKKPSATTKTKIQKNKKKKSDTSVVHTNVKAEQKNDVLVESTAAQAKVVEEKRVFVFHSEKKLMSSPTFETMTIHFKKEKKSPGNNLKCSPTMKIHFDDETAKNGGLMQGKSGKRNSSIGVDSNLSFEFAETQEPCLEYKFE